MDGVNGFRSGGNVGPITADGPPLMGGWSPGMKSIAAFPIEGRICSSAK